MMVAGLLAEWVQRALLAGCALVLAAALPATPAAAQGTAPDECAGKDSAAEEIACLREALEQSRRGLGRVEGGAVTEPPSGAGERAPVAPAAPAATPRNLGAEQVVRGPDRIREPARSPERLVGTIVAARPDARGLLMVRLDNGQIWQQTEQAAVPVSIDQDERNTVEISRSGFGGYRMHLREMGRTMVVKRIE